MADSTGATGDAWPSPGPTPHPDHGAAPAHPPHHPAAYPPAAHGAQPAAPQPPYTPQPYTPQPYTPQPYYPPLPRPQQEYPPVPPQPHAAHPHPPQPAQPAHPYPQQQYPQQQYPQQPLPLSSPNWAPAPAGTGRRTPWGLVAGIGLIALVLVAVGTVAGIRVLQDRDPVLTTSAGGPQDRDPLPAPSEPESSEPEPSEPEPSGPAPSEPEGSPPAEPDPASSPTPAQPPATPTPAAGPTPAGKAAVDLSKGDCIKALPGGTSIVRVPVVPCDEPHQMQVGSTFSPKGSAYPGTAALAAAFQSQCPRRLRAVLRPGGPSVVFRGLYPEAKEWAAGDHSVKCMIAAPPGSLLVGSWVR